MLQLDMNRTYTRIRAPATDFLSKNRRAIKDIKLKTTDTEKKPLRPHPPSHNPSCGSHAHKNRSVAAASTGRSGNGNTVVVSKAYLDQLVRMSVAGANDLGTIHRDVDPRTLGLQQSSMTTFPTPSHTHNSNNRALSPLLSSSPLQHQLPQRPVPQSNEPLQRRAPSTEDYFPFGRPGCGAPLRTESGQVMADLRKKTRYALPGLPRDEASGGQHSQAGGQEGGKQLRAHAPLKLDHTRKTGLESDEPLQHRAPGTEDYFPFGRPGCGAPLRTESGQVMADLRKRTKLPESLKKEVRAAAPTQSHLVPESGEGGQGGGQLRVSAEMASPRYARGAGPHVNAYVLRDKEEKRKKEMEHVEYLKAQIAAKEEVKRKQRAREEREEREEMERLARDRQKIELDFHRETERARKKEEESKQRQSLLQKAINDAAQAALAARQQVKNHHQSPARHHQTTEQPYPQPSQSTLSPSYTSGAHQTVSFDLRNTHTMESSGEMLPAKFNTSFRSPSMLQLSSNANHSPSPSSHKRQRTEPAVVTTEKGKNSACSKGSRIPVRSKPGGKGHRSSKIRPPAPEGHSQHKTTTTVENRRVAAAPPRAASPPVPALAKKLGLQKHSQGNAVDTSQQRHLPSLAPPPPVNPKAAVASRILSPPVPALARKIKYAATANNSKADLPVAAVHGRAPEPSSSTHLPPLVTAPTDNINERPHPHRHHVILQELSQLRKGLLSHRSTIDHKLATLYSS